MLYNFARFEQLQLMNCSVNQMFSIYLIASHLVVEARSLFNKAKPIKEALLRESALVTNNDKKPAPFKFIKVRVSEISQV